MEKTSFEEFESKRQNLRESMEKLKADASQMIAYTHQLRGLHNHFDSWEASTKKRSRELDLKEKELQSLSLDLEEKSKTFEEEKIKAGDLKKFTEECTRELRSKKDQLTEKLEYLTRIRGVLELKNKELGQVTAGLKRCCNEVRKVQEHKRELEDETARKKGDLSLVVNQIEESGKRVDSKSEELEEVQKLIEQQTKELVVLRSQRDSSKLLIQELSGELVAKEKIHKEILETICRSSSEMEERAKEIKAAETEASQLNVRSKMLKQEVEGKEKELDLLKNQIESEEKKLLQRRREMEEETDRKHKDLVLVLSKIEESGKQLAAGDELLGSLLKRLEVKSVELLSKEMELECVGESSKRFKFDLEVKEKRFHVLNNLITISAEQLDSKSKDLQEIQRVIKLKKQMRQMSVRVKHEKQSAAAPINDTIQQNAAETEPLIEDALTQHGLTASLTRQEVSIVLRALPIPAEFILEEVKEHISEELGSQDSLLEILVLFFEELAEIRQSYDPQLEPKATQVATLWKGKITIDAPKSSLEVLAFLMFIVAYGLKKLVNEEEIAVLVSSIAHFEQAPRLFNSLSLNPEIQNSVKVLIKKSQFIPVVRLICLFKFYKEFSPSDLLLKEMIKLRRSSQAKDKDAGRLRAILELVADYKLDINLPGDVIAKLMIKRENSPPLVC